MCVFVWAPFASIQVQICKVFFVTFRLPFTLVVKGGLNREKEKKCLPNRPTSQPFDLGCSPVPKVQIQFACTSSCLPVLACLLGLLGPLLPVLVDLWAFSTRGFASLFRPQGLQRKKRKGKAEIAFSSPFSWWRQSSKASTRKKHIEHVHAIKVDKNGPSIRFRFPRVTESNDQSKTKGPTMSTHSFVQVECRDLEFT